MRVSMAITAAIHHLTHYKYDRPVTLGPQIIRLRPAPHSRTRVISHSLKVSPGGHFVNHQQDAYGNWLARFVFPEPVHELRIEVDLVADMTVYNPFDFFVEEAAQKWPFDYAEEIRNGSETGRQIAGLYENGELVPDEIVVRLIEKKIANANGVKGFIFKGFPRTLVQSYILDGLLRKHGSGVSMVIDVAVPLLDVVQRLGAMKRVTLSRPEGAFYAFFAVDGMKDSVAFAQKLIDECGVGLAPGRAFSADGEGWMRLCFAVDTATVSAAMDRLEPVLG